MNLKIGITGSSGFLGTLISGELKKRGHEVYGISRELLYGSTSLLSKEIEGTDVIINLAGATILQRWTKKNKKLIYESRVNTTRNLVNALNSFPSEKQPRKFISASAIGIYKTGFTHNENSTEFNENFDGIVVKAWENASESLNQGIQRIILRIGLVLGKKAKTIVYSKLPFKLGLGATIGNGKQPFPYIHETDLVNAFIWAVEELQTGGIFNVVAPQNITNKDFTKALAKAMNRPAIFMIPTFILKIILGESAVLLTGSPDVKPEKLQTAGFNFLFPDIDKALREIVNT